MINNLDNNSKLDDRVNFINIKDYLPEGEKVQVYLPQEVSLKV